MKGLVFITVFSVLLFVSTIESRHELGYPDWRSAIKDESLPEAIRGLLIHSDPNSLLPRKKMDCTETLIPQDEKISVKDIKLRPQASFYPNDIKTEESSTNDAYLGKVDSKKEKPLSEDFEPRPNLSIYNN